MEDDNTSGLVIIAGVAMFLVAAFIAGSFMNSIYADVFTSKGMTIPCEKIVVVTEKYDAAVYYGGMPRISHIIVVNGQKVPFHDNFALDGGSSAFSAMPIGVPMILVGATDVNEGVYASGYRVVSYKRSSDVVNGCILT